MSEEKDKKDGFFSNIKNQIATGVGVVLTGISTMFIDEVKTFVGINEDEGEKTEQVEAQQNQSVNVTGPSINITIPEQKPTETKTIIREVPVEKKKEKEEEIDW